jgi:membrane protease YdiL (CAAX protease family)
LSALVGGGTFLLAGGALAAPALAAIIVAEVSVLLDVALLAAAGPWPAAVEAFGLRLRRRDAAAGVLVGGLTVLAAMLVYFLVGAWGPLSDALVWVGRDGERLRELALPVVALSILRATLLTPVGEELLFRGALFGWLRTRLPAWPTIVLTSALWTAAHFGVPAGLPYVFVMGLALGWLRERYSSVMPGLILHFVHNSLVFIVVFAVAGW